jgi:hypothetical protein
MHALDSQHPAAPRSPGFENFLPPAGSHARPKAVHTGAVAALGLISSFGHDNLKPLFLIFLMEEKLYLYA